MVTGISVSVAVLIMTHEQLVRRVLKLEGQLRAAEVMQAELLEWPG